MTTVPELLLFAPVTFPSELGVNLATAQFEESAEDLAQLKPFDLAKLLVAKQVSTNTTAVEDANTFQSFLTKCFGEAPSQTVGATAVAVNMPAPQVTVNIPKDFNQMVLSEALAFVNSNKSDQGLQLQLLERGDIKKAIETAGTDAIFASISVGTIDPNATMNVVSGLLNGDPYNATSNGVFLLTLGMALGTQVFQYKHPFDGSKLASNKIDSLGINFGKQEFSTEKFEVFVWLQSSPENIPQQLFEEIKKSSHSALYNDAISDGFLITQLVGHFRHAKNTLRLPSALAVDVIYREGRIAKKSSSFEEIEEMPQASRAESFLRTVLSSRNKFIETSLVSQDKKVFSSLVIKNCSEVLLNAICLDTVAIEDCSLIQGTIYTLSTTNVRISDITLEKLEHVPLTWSQLQNKYEEWYGKLRG